VTASPTLERIATLVNRRSGFHLPAERVWMLERRVTERCRLLEGCSLERYVSLLQSDGSGEIQHLIEALRVGQTQFFRLGDQLRALRRVALPEIVGCGGDPAPPARPLQVWCSGCATGEEPYTVAMVVDDWLQREQPGAAMELELLATDLSSEALEVARAARYSAEAVQAVPPALLERYFDRLEDGTHRVRQSLRDRVSFREHNLVGGLYPCEIDLLFCRNVLIYFDRQTREHVAGRLASSLSLHGFLFLGAGEALSPTPSSCSMLRTPDGLVYQRTPVVAEPAMPEPVVRRTVAPPLEPATSLPRLIQLQGSYEADRLTRALREAVEREDSVVLDLDGASYLAPGCARVIRRLASNLGERAHRLVLVASRPPVMHWLNRHRETLKGIERRARGESEP